MIRKITFAKIDFNVSLFYGVHIFVHVLLCVCLCVTYLKQPSQSMLPMFSLMVLSETKAGYSVSHGTCMVLPNL